MAKAILDRIGLHARGDLVHEGFVRERVLQAAGRSQRSGEERRSHRVRGIIFRAGPATAAAPGDGKARIAPLLNDVGGGATAGGENAAAGILKACR